MNAETTSKPEYINYLLKKRVFNIIEFSNNTHWYGWESSKKELAFLESGYPFEEGVTFEQALRTKARFAGFRNEFKGGVKDPDLFDNVKDMADWKRYLSLGQIRHAVWERP
jgi:hypothetical protein